MDCCKSILRQKMSFTYLIKNDVRIFGSMGEVLHNAYVLSQKDSFSSFQRPKWFNVKLDLLDMKYYQGKKVVSIIKTPCSQMAEPRERQSKNCKRNISNLLKLLGNFARQLYHSGFLCTLHHAFEALDITK